MIFNWLKNLKFLTQNPVYDKAKLELVSRIFKHNFGILSKNIFNGKKSKLTQILLYAYLAHKNKLAPLHQLQVGLFPLGKSEGEPLMLKNTPEMLNPTFMQEWENSLLSLIEGMFSRTEFQHKEESQYCQFCRDAGRWFLIFVTWSILASSLSLVVSL